MDKQKKASIDKKTKEIPIKWHIPDNIISRYANQVLVDIIENEFKLSFFELKPEIRLDPKTPLPTEVRADCVANIILPPHKIPKLIEALQKQFDQFVKITGGQLKF